MCQSVGQQAWLSVGFLYVLVPADVMQNFSIRPEVQLRALNKLLTMPEEDLGKGAGTSPQAPKKGWEVEMEQGGWRWELPAFHFRLLTGSLPDPMLTSRGG